MIVLHLERGSYDQPQTPDNILKMFLLEIWMFKLTKEDKCCIKGGGAKIYFSQCFL